MTSNSDDPKAVKIEVMGIDSSMGLWMSKTMVHFI